MATTAVTTLNRVQYSGLDFSTYEDEIIARLQVRFAATYNDFVASSLGIMLIDVFAFGLDTLAFYLDRRATDNFLVTGRTRKSVARAARQLGYKMGAAVASSVDLTVAPTQVYTFDIPISIGFQFKGPNNLLFEAQQAFTWTAGSNASTVITCSEGQTLQSTYTSSGLANQVLPIANVPAQKFVVGPGSNGQSKCIVTVDGVEWAESELLSFGATNQFEIGYNDSPPTLRFGDGVAGNIPPVNAPIVLTFFASSGVSGQVLAGTIQTVNSPLVVNFTNINLSVNNPSASVGGADPESIESAKANAPLFFKSRGVNITAEDYQVRAGTYRDATQGAIAVAQAINVKSASDDAFLDSKLNAITSDAENISSSIASGTAALISGPLAAIALDITLATGPTPGINTLLALLGVDLSGILTSTTAIKTAISQIQVGQGQISAAGVDLSSRVNAITTGGSDGLTAATKAALLADIAIVNTGSASVDPSTIATQNGLVVTNTNDAQLKASAIQTKATDILTQQASAVTQAEALSTVVGTLVLDIGSIATSGLTFDINEHVNSFVSADCQANLVEVPVLTLDADGFYAVPTNGLMKSLQTYLDLTKEVSQVVKVTGAAAQLVLANLTVKCGIVIGYVEATVLAQVQAAILNVLRGRAFGAKLFLDELYGPVAPSTGNIQGLASVNIKITNATVDADGNLPVSPSQVVTRGTITVVEI